ncbi:hypothetical protein D777_02465 [Marinobacter nitratireducens]|uniref:Uncharacterized protein n=1 Tax=Marinobacter nitratireducens TaxID=1137280 RepID=A0A072N0P2_9GAMM|nr:hypothetical protein [Marinobacter nitratireducens]KEF30523.1 hypothetical protein D777_02465 [Marinobacter nitratireducens]
MNKTEVIARWDEKCREATWAKAVYEQDPSPTNYSVMKRALFEKGLAEHELNAGAVHACQS